MYTIGMRPKYCTHYSSAHWVLERLDYQQWFHDVGTAEKVAREAEQCADRYEFKVFALIETSNEGAPTRFTEPERDF